MEDPGKHIKRGLVWLGSAAAAARVIDLLAMLAVLFFLTKEELGIATIAWTIGMLLEACNRFGLDIAIVQTKSISKLQLNSVFWFTLGVSGLLGTGAVLLGPLIGPFFDEPDLGAYLIPAAFKLLFLAWANIPIQLMNRELRYESIAGVNTFATLFAALSRVGLAAGGAGAWALLIAHALHGVFIWMAALFAQPFLPRLRFSFSQLRPLLGFGVFVTGNGLIYQLYRNVDYLILGAFAGPSVVGVYRVAFDIAMEPAIAVGDVINRTALPVLARLRDSQLVQTFIQTARTLALIMSIVAALVIVGAPDITMIFRAGEYTAAGLPAQVLACVAFMRVIYQMFPTLFEASGMPGMAFRLGLLSLSTLVPILMGCLFALNLGNQGLAISIGWLIEYPLLLSVALFVASKRLDLGIFKFLRSLLWPCVVLLVSAAAGVCVRSALSELGSVAAFSLSIVVTLSCYAILWRWSRSTPVS